MTPTCVTGLDVSRSVEDLGPHTMDPPSQSPGNHLSPPESSRRQRRSTSFLHLHIPEPPAGWPHWGLHPSIFTSHLHLPSFTLTGPTTADGGESHAGRKFTFGLGLRRFSHTTLHRSESMVSLCFRSLVNYITDDNLIGLQNFLENKRVQVDDRDENGSTALIVAAGKGKLLFVRELVNHGADVNAEDADNWTALLCAAKEGFTDICVELLEHGADLEHRDLIPGEWRGGNMTLSTET
uniref:Uncharacterized protein n=1 Tax=Timema genevievae TaxID=629358 RepID=A0A7R9KA70_TIMGE|nr:unnamed protein product [Timema genevievae]